nr:hypothetical protein [uncultured Halomonas sp.]
MSKSPWRLVLTGLVMMISAEAGAQTVQRVSDTVIVHTTPDRSGGWTVQERVYRQCRGGICHPGQDTLVRVRIEPVMATFAIQRQQRLNAIDRALTRIKASLQQDGFIADDGSVTRSDDPLPPPVKRLPPGEPFDWQARAQAHRDSLGARLDNATPQPFNFSMDNLTRSVDSTAQDVMPRLDSWVKDKWRRWGQPLWDKVFD